MAGGRPRGNKADLDVLHHVSILEHCCLSNLSNPARVYGYLPAFELVGHIEGWILEKSCLLCLHSLPVSLQPAMHMCCLASGASITHCFVSIRFLFAAQRASQLHTDIARQPGIHLALRLFLNISVDNSLQQDLPGPSLCLLRTTLDHLPKLARWRHSAQVMPSVADAASHEREKLSDTLIYWQPT